LSFKYINWGKVLLHFTKRRAIEVSMLYAKAREMFEKDARETNELEAARVRKYRRLKPVPSVKK
jgi:hypothetical protein